MVPHIKHSDNDNSSSLHDITIVEWMIMTICIATHKRELVHLSIYMKTKVLKTNLEERGNNHGSSHCHVLFITHYSTSWYNYQCSSPVQDGDWVLETVGFLYLTWGGNRHISGEKTTSHKIWFRKFHWDKKKKLANV